MPRKPAPRRFLPVPHGLLALLLLPFAALPATAATIHVPGDHGTIGAAVLATTVGDTVLIAPGVYSGPGNHDIGLSDRSIVVRGDGAPEDVVIDCLGSGRAFICDGDPYDPTQASIENLSIVGGDPSQYGDARGGAIYVEQGAFTLKDLRISNCRTDSHGGAIVLRWDRGSTLTDVRIENCESGLDGGAILLYRSLSPATMSGILVRDNRAGGIGAGIRFAYGADANVVNSTFVGNEGSAMSAEGSCNVSVIACLIAFQTGSDPALDMDSLPDPFTVLCNDVFANAGGNYDSDIGDQTGLNGNFSVEPRFCDPAGGDFTLAANSPCLPPNNSCGANIGAFGEGCAEQSFHSITGRIWLEGVGLAGVRLTGGSYEATSDANGEYRIDEAAGWSGTLTPVLPTYSFDPPSRSYAALAQDETAQDYDATRVPGIIHVPTGMPTIQEAIDFAMLYDTVLVAPGTYGGEGFGGINFQGKELVVVSAGGPEATILEYDSSQFGWNAFRFDVGEGPGAVVQGFKLRGFPVNYDGGALHCRNGTSPTFRDLIIEDNHGSVGYPNDAYGGGLQCSEGASPRFESCVFRSNAASSGGAVRISDSSPQFIDCLFEDNDARQGGAVYLYGGAPRFERCEFRGNTGNRCWTDDVIFEAGAGGAVYAWGGSAEFIDCLFEGNTAEQSYPVEPYYGSHTPGRGGAVYGWGSTLLIEGCTFAGNVSMPSELDLSGTLHFADSGEDRVISSIVALDTVGHGLFLDVGATVPDVSCCDVWGNSAGNPGGDMPDPVGVDGNFSLNPLFCDFAGGLFTLAANSPCLPTGNSCGLQIGAFGEGCSATPAQDTPLPGRLTLRQNSPNPFNPSTEIAFALPAPSAVSLEIYDVSGRSVARLIAGAELSAGWHQVDWQGRDDAGRPSPSGVYFYRLVSENGIATRKMLLLK